MNYIKKHWKEILIAMLVVLSLNKCTVACNRDTKIGKKCVKMFKKQFSSTFHDEIEMEKQLNSFLNMPIRCGCMGGFNDRLALAIVALANHKYLKALTEFLKGRRK